MKSLSLRHGIALFALTVLSLLSLPAVAEMQTTLSGYIQARATETLGDADASSLDVRRAYLVARATDGQHISAVVNLWAYPNPRLLEAYGEYAWTKDLKARFGLTGVPFGYESPLSSARLITLERSQVNAKLIYPYTFDTGAFGYITNVHGFNFAASVTNGRPVDIGNDISFTKDTNNTKNLEARIGYAIPGGQIGVSYWNGTLPTISAPTNPYTPPTDLPDLSAWRYGADLETAVGPFTILSEYVAAKTAGIEANGYYLTLAYQAKGSTWQPYARFDVFDPDTDIANNEFQRYTVGVNDYLNPKTRITLEYENINDDLTPSVDGRISAQYQVAF
ncbi:MAG TPA: porin [Armatimonadota bacterium]|jgi:hypothetical protein